MTPAQLKALRIKARLTQLELGQLFGYSQSYITHIEAGRRSVPGDIAAGAKTIRQYGLSKARSVIENMTV